MKKNIFIFDLNKCVGCHACVVACMNENGFQEPDRWRNIHESQESHFPQLPLFYLSLACNHCDDAPCLKNCPALAYSRDDKTGAVIHDPDKCIGCKYCTWACPYDAPKFNPLTGIIEKCNFCNQRIEEELKPACANLCPVGALDFVNEEFTREKSIASSPVPLDVGSNIKIKPLRKNTAPEIDINLFENQPEKVKPIRKHLKINAKKEWPLIIFTLLSTLMVSLYSSGLTGNFTFLQKVTFIGFGGIAAILSMLHLGKKFRVWCSLINIRSSWLSKEIAFLIIFFTAVFCDFYIINIPVLIVSFIGFLFLFSIDMLYGLAHWKWPLKIHSAQTTFIGISFFALFAEIPYLLIFILSFRLTIYIYRKLILAKNDWIITTLRILSPITVIVLILLSQTDITVFIILITGEAIDRIEFYNELNVPEPEKEIQTILIN